MFLKTLNASKPPRGVLQLPPTRLHAIERNPNSEKQQLYTANTLKTTFRVQSLFNSKEIKYFFLKNYVFSRNRDVFCSSRTRLFTSGGQTRLLTIDLINLLIFQPPGVVADACNPVSWRLGSLNGLRAGFLRVIVLCRSGVRAKSEVTMAKTGESKLSRLAKEKRESAQGGNTAGKSFRVKQ